MRNRKLRLLSLFLATVMMLGLLAGCNSSGGDDKKSSGGGSKDSIVIATMSETPSLSPYDHNATAGVYMNLLTYSTLFRTDVEMNPQPNLVESYENTSETEWVFKLKQGVKFHNGDEMKAEDVVASIEHGKTCPEINLFNRCVETIEAVDDYTFKITTPGPSAVLLNHLCHYGNSILPKKLLDEGHDFASDPVGSGPYKLVEWKRGDSVEFEAFADYFDGEAPIKHMTWKIIPEGSSRTIALEAGEIDFIVEVEAMDYDRLAGNDEVAIYEYDATEHNWMMLNNEKPGLDNENVRKAMDCAIDKESVIAVALNGMGTAIYSQAPNNMPGASEENVNSFDVEQAKKYMEESGVDPASIEMSIICSNDTKKRAAEVIQANLKDTLGITATIESMDLATYMSVTAEGNYTASIGNFTSSDMISFLFGVFHSKSIDGSNKTRLNNSEVDALIDKASATIDATERDKVLQECISLINTLTPQVPLYQPVNFRAYNANLQGVEVSPSGTLYFEDVSWK